jgi:hypothetical protein
MSSYPGNLQIANDLTVPVSMVITPGGCTCCDAPLAATSLGVLEPAGTHNLSYVRTDGHGCDGEQGYFQLAIVGTAGTLLVALNFDSDANMGQPTLQWVASPNGGAPFTVKGPEGSFNAYMSIVAS